MADTFARQRQLIGWTADWAANDIILGQGEIGVERVSGTVVRIKIGDGALPWSGLPYLSSPTDDINAAVQAAIDSRVAKSGDTMTGILVLHADPAADMDAATKRYVDVVRADMDADMLNQVSRAGDTMTGPLMLHADPTVALQAATKGYVDTELADFLPIAGGGMTGPLTLHADPIDPLEAATKEYVDNGPQLTAVGGSASYAGKTVKLNHSGVIDSSMLSVGSTYLGTINMTLPYALTGTYLPGNYFAVAVSGTIDSSWATKLNTPQATCSSGQSLIFSASGKWDLIGENMNSASLDSKLDKSGGTMTGPLIVHGAPTQPLEATSKTYVDNAVAAKADASHTHTTAQVTGLDTALAAKASLASPAFTGNPTAPTPAAGDNDTSIATTAFVQQAVATVPERYHATDYRLTVADAGCMVNMHSAADIMVIVPLAAGANFPVNTRIDILRWGTGHVTVVGDGGVSVVSADNKTKLRVQYSAATLWKQAADIWVLIGDLA